MADTGSRHAGLMRKLLVMTLLACMPLSLFAQTISISWSAQSTSLFLNQEGSWTVTATNTNTTTALTNGRMEIVLITGFEVTDAGGGTISGTPSTGQKITWNGVNIPANNGTFVKTFKARPGCSTTANTGSHIANVYNSSNTLLRGVPSSTITIRRLTPSVSSESTVLSAGQEGSWTFSVTNNSNANCAVSRTIVAQVPADFLITDAGGGVLTPGSPQTITWTVAPTWTNGTSKNFTVKAQPKFGAQTLQTVSLYADCPSVSVTSSPIKVLEPNPTVTILSGGSAQPTVYKGDTVLWDIAVKNGGPGDLVGGITITQVLGAAYAFVSLKDEAGNPVTWTGNWNTGAIWNAGPIPAGTQKIFKLATTVIGCSDFAQNLTGSWTDGVTTRTLTASANANFVKRLPQIGIQANIPSTLAYCGYVTLDSQNRGSIRITNTGQGPAKNFVLTLSGLPADWGIQGLTVVQGGAGTVSWNAATASFQVGDLTAPGQGRDIVEFTFVTGPTGSACPVTQSASMILLPSYSDECGVVGAPPVLGPYGLTVDTAPIPRATLQMTGPGHVHANNQATYTIVTSFQAPASYGTRPFTVTFNYPAGFTVNSMIPAGGIDDPINQRILWHVNMAPGSSSTMQVVLNAPTPCGAGQNYSVLASIVSDDVLQTCLSCPIQPSATGGVSTWVDNDIQVSPLLSATRQKTYYNSVLQAFDAGLQSGEVCSDVRYVATYRFNQDYMGAASWQGFKFDDTAVLGQTFVRIDDVRVNGVSYWDTANPPDPNAEFPGKPLDLVFLDATSAPKPFTPGNTELSIVYTMHAGSQTGWDVDFARLYVPDLISTGCSGKQYFETGTLVEFSASSLNVSLVAPTVIDCAEIKQFRIQLNPVTMWPLYDLSISMDIGTGYRLVGGVGDAQYPVQFNDFYTLSGTPIPAFSPSINGSILTWNFNQDVRARANADGTGASPSITFWLAKTCDIAVKNVSVTVRYNDRCTDNASPAQRTAVTTGSPALVRKGELEVSVQPARVKAYDMFPTFDIVIWNKGSGNVYDAFFYFNNPNNSLNAYSYSIPQGPAPDVVETLPAADAVWRYHLIPPGEKRYFRIKDRIGYLPAGSGDTITTNLQYSWGLAWPDELDPRVEIICQQLSKPAYVDLVKPQVLISAHTVDHVIDYCGDPSRFTVTAKNTGTTIAFNPIIEVQLPPGLSYAGNVVFSFSGGPLDALPAVSQTGTVAAGLVLRYDFTNAIPADAYGDRYLGPGQTISVAYDAVIANSTDALTYSNGSKRSLARVLFDEPARAYYRQNLLSSSQDVLATMPATPSIQIAQQVRNITQGTAWGSPASIAAEPDDVLEFKFILQNVGNYVAKNVRLSIKLPTVTTNKVLIYNSGTLTVEGAPVSWDGTSTIDIGLMSNISGDPSQIVEVGYQASVNFATNDASAVNYGTVSWGCYQGVPTIPPAYNTLDSSKITIITAPLFSGTMTTITYPVTGLNSFSTDGGRIRVTFKNQGTRAYFRSGNNSIYIQFPSGSNFNDAFPISIQSDIRGNLIETTPPVIENAANSWEGGRVRLYLFTVGYIDTNETLTIEVSGESSGFYMDTEYANAGPLKEPPAFSTASIYRYINYDFIYDKLPNTIYQTATWSPNPIATTVYQPDLDITLEPVNPVINPGETTKTFTVKIKNNGNTTAKNVAKVNAYINQPFVMNFGAGFANPVITSNTCGGTATVSGNTITIANMSDFAAGSEKSITVTVGVVPNQNPDQYWADARIRGTSVRDLEGRPVQPKSPGVNDPMNINYSDDYVKVVAASGLVLRPDNQGTGQPGSFVTYLHMIRNNGAVADDFLLSATSTPAWNVLFYATNEQGVISGGPITKIYLAPQQTAYFAARVFIPSTAAEGTIALTTIKAAMKSNTSYYRAVQDVTMVTSSRLSMFKEARNVQQGSPFGMRADGKPAEDIEYRISFKNIAASDITDLYISDPLPDFTWLLPDTYSYASQDWTVKLLFNFADGQETVYLQVPDDARLITIHFNDLCASPPLNARFPDGVFRLSPGESGSISYMVRVR